MTLFYTMFVFSFPSGFVPICLSILQSCKDLTDQLVAMTMSHLQQYGDMRGLGEVVAAAQGIPPRVDTLVDALMSSPQIHPQIMESR